MNNTRTKNGPIHFYPTAERDANISNVVEYCVQIGERQPLTETQAAWLVASKQVTVEGQLMNDLAIIIPHGTWEIMVRSKKHHVVVHPAIME
jgi:hypothetical protein